MAASTAFTIDAFVHVAGGDVACAELAVADLALARDSGRAADGLARRRAAEGRGRDAEQAVVDYWQERGFEVLARRVRTKVGEIDVVVADGRTLVFVEVKARAFLLRAVETLPAWRQARLLNAAEYLMAMRPDWRREETRFDVALVCGGGIEVIEDAIRYQ